MWGEIISAGASLLGGLFGKKKKQETTTRVNYQQMVDDASAAGFNPLTAIRNGGSAGFTTTTSPTVSAMPEVLGNLGGILGNALDNKLDPINAKKRELDTLLVDRQLRQLKEGPQIPGSFKTPRTFEGTKVSQQLVPRLGAASSKKTASVPAAFTNPNNYKVSDASITKYGDQSVWQPNPWLPSADTIETDYGDVGGSLYGFVKFPVDLAYNGYRWTKLGYQHYPTEAPKVRGRMGAISAGAVMGSMYKPPRVQRTIRQQRRPISILNDAANRDLSHIGSW